MRERNRCCWHVGPDVQCEVVAPLTLMGFGKRIEARPYTTDRGAPFPAFRILVEPSTVPEDDSQPE